ncbi:MAG: BACON domain-containing protein [Bacteroidales bacterium]|nr:BACON domain-containing protein [Bacteroidales bacterium]MBR1706933.1 BACON domain-containing protein [Bacteroidales bacterium]
MKKMWTWAALALAVVACDPEVLDGDWDPIQTDQEQLTFGQAGGTQTVRMTNYKSWWLCEAYDTVAWSETDGWQYQGLVYPEEGTVYHIAGAWYEAVIPEGARNTLTVTAQPNPGTAPREAHVTLTVGDAFKTITLYQH